MYKLAEQVCHTVLLMNSFQTSLLVSKYQFFFFFEKISVYRSRRLEGDSIIQISFIFLLFSTTTPGPARILHSFVDAVLAKSDTTGIAGAKIYLTFLVDSTINIVDSKSKLALQVCCCSGINRRDLLTK